MDAVIKIVQGDRAIGRDAEHGFHARRPEHDLAGHVDIPFAHVGRVDRQAQLLFALGQRLFVLFTFGNVAVQHDQAAVGREAMDIEPDRFSG
nr:hypothetical protein [Massilia violaceinigra]